MNDDNKSVVFVDAYNLIYRAFHGNKANMKNLEGLPTNAVYTTINMLNKIRKSFNNLTYCVAVFDGGKNFREDLDENYKLNRKPMPDNLRIQMPYIKEAFDILGWPTIKAENVEADDVIGSLGLRSSKAGYNTYIISGDKDFRQLVSENLHVLDTMQDICYDRDMVKEKMGIYPENVVAYLSLLGDSSDNVIGVDKIGETTAAKLLNEYGDIEGIRRNQEIIKGKVGENIRTAFANGQIDKNLQLIKLKTDLDLKYTSKELRFKEIDQERWIDFCTKMNFKKLMSTSLKPF